MKNVLILFLLSCLINLHAQSDQIIGNQYELEGRIISKISLPSHCGVIAWGTVIELEIISYSDTTYCDENIAVIFTCPEFYGKDFFKTGEKYNIVVADKNQASFGWAIPNLEILENYNLKHKLWVVKAIKSIN